MNIIKKIIPVGLTLGMAFSQASIGAGCDKALTKDFQKSFHDAREVAVPTEAETNNYFMHLHQSLQIELARTSPEEGRVLNKERVEAAQKAFSETEKTLDKKYGITSDHHTRMFTAVEGSSRACIFDRIDFPFSQKVTKSSDYTGISLTTKMCATTDGMHTRSYFVTVSRNVPPHGEYSISTNEVSQEDFQQAWQQATGYVDKICPAKYPRPSACSDPAARDRLGGFCY